MSIPTTRRKWLRFGIRSILILMLIVAFPLAWKFNKLRAQRGAVAAIEAAGGVVQYEYETNAARQDKGRQRFSLPAIPPGPPWLRDLLGDDFFADVAYVDLSTMSDSDAIALLPILRSLEGLEELEITSESLAEQDSLEHLRNCSTLRHLGVVVRPDSKTPGKRIGQALPNCKVRYLDVLEMGAVE